MSTRESDIQALLCGYCPLYKHIGLVVESSGDGVYRCRVPLDENNGNHLDTVHAAIQWAAAEMLGGLVVVSVFGPEQLGRLYAAVKSATIEFMRPARTSITAEAHFGSEQGDRLLNDVAAAGEGRFDLLATVRSTRAETVAVLRAEYIVRQRRTAASPVVRPADPASTGLAGSSRRQAVETPLALDRHGGTGPGILTREQADRFAREWIEAWNSHDLGRILAHYSDDFVMSSPRIAVVAQQPSGVLAGKAAITRYWEKALALAPDLHFELLSTFVSADSVAIHYKGPRGPAVEVFFFNQQGLVCRAAAHYV